MLIFLMIFASCIGCHQGKKDIPLSEKDLVRLLVDIHVTEAAIQDLYGPIKDSIGQLYYEQVFHRYNFDHNLFDSTMAILRRDPKYASIVYQRVMQEIDKKQRK